MPETTQQRKFHGYFRLHNITLSNSQKWFTPPAEDCTGVAEVSVQIPCRPKFSGLLSPILSSIRNHDDHVRFAFVFKLHSLGSAWPPVLWIVFPSSHFYASALVPPLLAFLLDIMSTSWSWLERVIARWRAKCKMFSGFWAHS